MACLSAVCSNEFLVCQDNFEFYAAKTKSLEKFRVFCCSSFPSKKFYNFGKPLKGLFWDGKFKSLVFDNVGISSIRFSSSCSSHPGLSCNDDIKPLRSGKSGPKQLHVGKIKNSKFKRRFSLRFRPRLWLLVSRMKRASVKCLLNDIGAFVQKNLRNLTLSATISVALGLCYLFLKVTALPSPKVVPYSDLVASLQNGSVSKVLLEEGSRSIYYNVNVQSGENIEMSDKESLAVSSSFVNVDDMVASGSEPGLGSSKSSNFNVFNKFSKAQVSTPKWQYCTRKIDHDEKFLLSLMRNKGTIYSSAPQSVLMSMRNTLITIMTLWIPLLPLMWLLYRQLSAANSPARKRRPNTEVVGFDDVKGVDAAKVELLEIVLCLQGAISYQKLGAKLPRGVLLVGPPGTGKTLLARAVAGEAGVPFLTVSASEFVEMFVGRGAARIRDLFKAARKCAPSIIFIDELDAVGGKRGRSLNDERDQTLNQLLTEMDGFESDTRVIVIAATNRPEALDSALCRPGRFSRKVLVGEPDEEGRRKILAVHLRGVPLEEDMHLICNLVASLTQGFVGADLANIVNEAALLAARKGGETVTREDIMEAIERAKFGIVDKQLRPSTLSKELGKLFPWMPSLIGKNEARQEGLQGPLGYQTLS